MTLRFHQRLVRRNVHRLVNSFDQSLISSHPTSAGQHVGEMSALFNFQSLLTVVLLLICTCTYLRAFFPTLLDKNKHGLLGSFWKCARIGERKSPYIGVCCIAMAVNILFWS